MRQRIDFTQISDEAMRCVDAPLICADTLFQRRFETDGATSGSRQYQGNLPLPPALAGRLRAIKQQPSEAFGLLAKLGVAKAMSAILGVAKAMSAIVPPLTSIRAAGNRLFD